MLLIVMKSSLPVYNIVGGGGGVGGEEVPYFNDVIRYCPQNTPCQRIFVLSDPGVPRPLLCHRIVDFALFVLIVFL